VTYIGFATNPSKRT